MENEKPCPFNPDGAYSPPGFAPHKFGPMTIVRKRAFASGVEYISDEDVPTHIVSICEWCGHVIKKPLEI